MDKGIDKGKQRTLERLFEKGEKTKSYPIGENDLVRINDCRACGSKNISLITELYLKDSLNFFSTCSCNDCLYTFRSISPSFDWFKKCWKQIEDENLEVFNPSIEEIRKKRYGEYKELLSGHFSGKNVLDIGSAYGTGAKVFSDSGFVVSSIEPEANKAKYIEKKLGIPVVGGSIEEFVFKKNGFDLVLMAHCLEHIDNPFPVIKQMKNIINEGGILYLEIPTLWNHVTWTDALYLTHKSNFIESNITKLVHQSGFEILEEKFFRHSEEEPIGLGLILRRRKGPAKKYKFSDKRNIINVKEQYRKNIPLEAVPPLDQVLRYSVNSIEHFYQTVRLDNKILMCPDKERGFIRFLAK